MIARTRELRYFLHAARALLVLAGYMATRRSRWARLGSVPVAYTAGILAGAASTILEP